MAYVKNFVANPVNGNYLLPNDSAVHVNIIAGECEPFSSTKVKYTRLRIYSDNGNAYVQTTAAGAIRFSSTSSVVPTGAPIYGPVIDENTKEFIVEYEGQSPRNGPPYWSFDAWIQPRPSSTGFTNVHFVIELLDGNKNVYAVSQYPRTIRFQIYDSATGVGTAPNEAPTGIVVKPTGSKKMELTWNGAPRATETRIEYKLPADPSFVLLATVQGSGAQGYEHTGLTQLTTYQYRLRSQNVYGNGPYSSTYSAKTFSTPSLPGAPTILNAYAPDYSSILVTFDQSDEVPAGDGRLHPNTYNLYYRLTSDPDVAGSYTQTDVDNTQTNILVTGLAANTSYTLYMTAENEAGESTATSQSTVVTPENTDLPETPTNFTATTARYIDMELAWEMPSGTQSNEAGFGLYYSTDNGVTYTPYDPPSNAILPRGSRSYTATGLDPSTTYKWALFAYNFVDGVLTTSTYVYAEDTTDVTPTQPGAPTLDSLTSVNNNTIRLNYSPSVVGETLGYKIYRSATAGVDNTDTLVANVAASVTEYEDTGLSPNARYYYAVYAVGYTADVGPSNELDATTLRNTGDVQEVSGFTLHADSRNRIKEVADSTFITSDLDRWVIRDNRTGSWYKAGLRPIKGSVSLSKTSGGVLENGVYRVYLVLCRGARTRSIPSSASAEVTINSTSRTLVVTPPLNDDGDAIECRDLGYDVYGNSIKGADAWEVYIAEQNQPNAYRVARINTLNKADWEDTVGSGTYTIDATLTKQDIFGGTRRPMEVLGESSLPPSCWEIEVKDNRVVCTGEVDIEPAEDEVEAGATLAITGGNKYFEVTDWDATDACVYHKLFINDIDTGWEVWDYDYDAVDTTAVTKCYIRHSDPAVNAAGFEGAGGSFTDFALKGNPNRVYYSAYFSGEALAQTTYSPETFPPLTVFESEFFPDDNTSPKGLIAIRESLLVAKDDKWVLATGGDEPDFPLITTDPISRGSGLNASDSMARDSNDVVYYLGDTGPFRVTPGGVEKVNVRFGNARLFQEVFDIASVPNAKGAWFSREDWYVVVGLNRIGRSGNRDGFVLDMKNGAIMPFSTPYAITHVKEYKNTGGEFQLLFGTTNGRIGYLFKKDLYVDGMNYTQDIPTLSAGGISCYLVTGIVDTEHALVPRWIQPRVKAIPYDTPFLFQFQYDGKTRCSDPTTFVFDDQVVFTPQTDGDHVSLASGRYDQLQFRLLVTTRTQATNAYFEIKELPLCAVVKNAS